MIVHVYISRTSHQYNIIYIDMSMNMMWQSLPRDVVHLILKFDGRIVYRTGQYINQIPPADPRYDMLLTQRPMPCTGSDSHDDIIDITVKFKSKPDACFKVSINSIYDDEDDKMYRWVSYSYISPNTWLSPGHTMVIW